MHRMDHHTPDQQIGILPLEGDRGAGGITGHQPPLARAPFQPTQHKATLVHRHHGGT